MKKYIKTFLFVSFGIILIISLILFINHETSKSNTSDLATSTQESSGDNENVTEIVTEIETETSIKTTEPYTTPVDKPTIPSNLNKDLYYIYDFTFSERYDARMKDDFSLNFSDVGNPTQENYTLFDSFKDLTQTAPVIQHESDDLVPPEQHKLYWYTMDNGGLFVDTDYFELDQREYIAYLWTNIEGAKTNKTVAVGSSENDLLIAYKDNLLYLEKDEALSEKKSNLLSFSDFSDEHLATLEEKYDFDYAYVWQPFTPETNDIRDITFFMKNDTVIAMEIIKPSELRHVYGYDRELGLQQTEEKRNKALENMNPAEKLVIQYANALENHQWDEFISLFEYSDETSSDLLEFLKDEDNIAKKEGIHGVISADVLKIEPTTDNQLMSKGDQVYDVYIEMSVENPSDLYENGISVHTFVFKVVDNDLKIETVYYGGLYEK